MMLLKALPIFGMLMHNPIAKLISLFLNH
jgi:hypothetical protein